MAKKSESSDFDIVNLITDELNKKGKGETLAFNLADPNSPHHITDWVSGGSSVLDMLVSNLPYGEGGTFACGRVTELYGLEGSGKSLVCAHAVKSTQEKGGVAVWVDSETSLDNTWLEAIGIDLTKLIYVNTNSLEEMWETVERTVVKLEEKKYKGIITIILDSLTAASHNAELSTEDYGTDGYATQKARINSKALRKITKMIADKKVALILTRQVRVKLGAGIFEDPWTTTGGKAVDFHTSARILLKNAGKLKVGDALVGNRVRAITKKNRMAPPGRNVEFNVYYDRGIDDPSSILDWLVKEKAIEKASAQKYEVVNSDTGQVWQFTKKKYPELWEESEDFRNCIRALLYSCIMQTYQYNVDDVQVVSERDLEDEEASKSNTDTKEIDDDE